MKQNYCLNVIKALLYEQIQNGYLMEFLKKSVLLFATLLTALAGSLPPGSVICQAVDGNLIIENSCNCESEIPPCCDDNDCHEDPQATEDCHEKSICAADKCVDTLVSVENYTEQDLITVPQMANEVSFNEYLTLIASINLPMDTGKENFPDPPPLPPAHISIIKSTVLII